VKIDGPATSVDKSEAVGTRSVASLKYGTSKFSDSYPISVKDSGAGSHPGCHTPAAIVGRLRLQYLAHINGHATAFLSRHQLPGPPADAVGIEFYDCRLKLTARRRLRKHPTSRTDCQNYSRDCPNHYLIGCRRRRICPWREMWPFIALSRPSRFFVAGSGFVSSA
jgi:hypothetical protein